MNNQETGKHASDRLLAELNDDAESAGYHLNPDTEFARSLVESLLVNEKRYGYRACPCRLATGNAEEDRDIVCPCDYRDADVEEFGACYCALYVSEEVKQGKKKARSIPERRPPAAERKKRTGRKTGTTAAVSMTVWRCTVCGYLCAREQPPGICPICKAKKERFEIFLAPS